MSTKKTEIQSPCVRNCCLDRQDVCLGCGRTVDEIIIWGDATNQLKTEILIKAKGRKEARDK